VRQFEFSWAAGSADPARGGSDGNHPGGYELEGEPKLCLESTASGFGCALAEVVGGAASDVLPE